MDCAGALVELSADRARLVFPFPAVAGHGVGACGKLEGRGRLGSPRSSRVRPPGLFSRFPLVATAWERAGNLQGRPPPRPAEHVSESRTPLPAAARQRLPACVL